MARTVAEKVLWHDLDDPIAYALRSGVGYDKVIATLRDKIAHVERCRDADIAPEHYRRGLA